MQNEKEFKPKKPKDFLTVIDALTVAKEYFDYVWEKRKKDKNKNKNKNDQIQVEDKAEVPGVKVTTFAAKPEASGSAPSPSPAPAPTIPPWFMTPLEKMHFGYFPYGKNRVPRGSFWGYLR